MQTRNSAAWLSNELAHASGELPQDRRLYHLDLYRGTSHETHGFYEGLPKYETVRAAVLDILSGKTKPMSSSRM